jgi:lipopolysaccharide export system permease protein
MKIILYRYTLKEQLVPLSVCFFGLSIVLITGRLMQLARYLFTSSLTVGDLALVIGLAMPKLFLYILPMAALMGVLLAFVRLSNDNEVVAMRAAGISFSQFAPSVLTVLILVTALALYSAIWVMPATNKAFRDKLKSLGQASLPALLKEGTFIDTVPKMVFFFQKVDASNLQLEGIFIRDDRQPDARVAIIAEDAGLVYQNDQSEVVFNIRNGSMTRVGNSLENTQVVSFKAYDLKIDFEEMLGSSEGGGKARGEMSLSELNRLFHSKSPKPLYRYALEFHQRLALPLGCLFLGLVGAPLGTLFRQGNRMTGVTLGLGIFLIYYVVLSAGKGLGENGVVQPIVAIWTPNILTFVLALYLWVKTERETPFKAARILEYLKTVVAALRRISWSS